MGDRDMNSADTLEQYRKKANKKGVHFFLGIATGVLITLAVINLVNLLTN